MLLGRELCGTFGIEVEGVGDSFFLYQVALIACVYSMVRHHRTSCALGLKLNPSLTSPRRRVGLPTSALHSQPFAPSIRAICRLQSYGSQPRWTFVRGYKWIRALQDGAKSCHVGGKWAVQYRNRTERLNRFRVRSK